MVVVVATVISYARFQVMNTDWNRLFADDEDDELIYFSVSCSSAACIALDDTDATRERYLFDKSAKHSTAINADIYYKAVVATFRVKPRFEKKNTITCRRKRQI